MRDVLGQPLDASWFHVLYEDRERAEAEAEEYRSRAEFFQRADAVKAPSGG